MTIKKIITIILCLEVFLVPLFLVPNVGPRLNSLTAFNFNKVILMLFLSLVAGFLFLVDAVEQARVKFVRTPLDYFIIGFFVLYTLGFVFSKDRYVSLFWWLAVLSLILFYYLVVNVIAKKQVLLSSLVGSAGLVSLVFLVSAFFLRQKLGVVNTLLSQTELAGFAAVAAILAQTVLLRAGRTDRGPTSVSSSARIKGDKGIKGIKGDWLLPGINFIALLLFLAVIALINFRIGWIVFTAGSLFLIGLALARADELNFKKQWLALPILMSLIGLFFLFLGTPLVYNLNLPAEVSLAQPLSFGVAWQESTKSLFGAGPGNFGIAFSEYKPETFSEGALWQLRFWQAPNFWTEILATTGWPGLLALALLVVMTLLIVFLQGGLLPVFLGLLAASFYLNFSVSWWLLFFTLIAVTIKRGESKEFVFKQSPYVRSLISFGLIIAIVFVIFVLSFFSRIYAADWYFRKGDFDSALKYNRLPEYYLAGADASLQRASVLSRAGDQEQTGIVVGRAINYSKQAFALAPNNAAICEKRAWIFEQARGWINGANEWAKKTYEECLLLEPNNPFFYQQLALTEELAGDQEGAISHLQKALALRSNLATAHYELGRIYYNKTDLEKAEAEFLRALTINRDYANALYSLALLYERLDRRQEALSLYKRVLELNPDSEDVKEKIRALEK